MVVFWLISIIDDVTTAVLIEKKRKQCHDHSFHSIFFKFAVWLNEQKTKYEMKIQLSTLSTSGQNGGLKNTKLTPR